MSIDYDWNADDYDILSVTAPGLSYVSLSVTYNPTADEEMLEFDLPFYAELWEEEGVVAKTSSFLSLDAAKLWSEAQDLMALANERMDDSFDSEYADRSEWADTQGAL